MNDSDIGIARVDMNSTPKRLWVDWAAKEYDKFPETVKLRTLVFVKAGKFRDHIIYECKE